MTPAPPTRGALDEVLRAAFADALARVDLVALAREALRGEPAPPRPSRAHGNAKPASPAPPQRLLALGKSAPALAAGALAAWPRAFAEVLVVAPEDTPVPASLARAARSGRIEILRAGHPLPDARSVVATERALAFAAVGPRGRLVSFVSGGTSALLGAPIDGVTLEDLAALTRDLLASGATVAEINVVRRRVSRALGGALARRAVVGGGDALTFVVGDVLGGTLADVGSGPTVLDPTGVEAARAILWRYVSGRAAVRLRDDDVTPIRAGALRAYWLLRPETFGAAVVAALRRRGLTARELPPSVEPVEALVTEYATRAAALAPGEAWVRVAEPSVRVAARDLRLARGGRSTHLAALLVRHLPERVTSLAGATDGVDGSSGTGGAVVDRARAEAFGLSRFAEAVAAFDTGPLHLAVGTALPEGPTGKNLCDVHILAREPAESPRPP